MVYTEKLEAQGLGLGHGAAATVLDLLGEELDRVLTESEALLDEGSQLANAASLVTEDLTGAGRADDDLGADRSHADLDTCMMIEREILKR